MPTDLNTAMDLLRSVQLKTKPAGMHPIRQAEQIKEYAHELVDCHPDDVVEACKLWPEHNREWPDLASLLDMIEGQKRQRLARERNPGQRADRSTPPTRGRPRSGSSASACKSSAGSTSWPSRATRRCRPPAPSSTPP
jgi:hypothetical protein